MGKKLYPTNTLQQARSIRIAWEQIDPTLEFGPLTCESLSTDIVTADTLRERIVHLASELVDLRNQRDAACIRIWDKVKRVRTGMKATYGDNSTQYQLAGGTRLMDRKKPRRRASSGSQ